MLATLSVAYYRAGDRPRADAIQKWLRAQSPPPIAALARLYAGRGDREAALDMLARVQNGNGLQQIKHDPVFDEISSDARFVSLTKNSRVGSERGSERVPIGTIRNLFRTYSEPSHSAPT